MKSCLKPKCAVKWTTIEKQSEDKRRLDGQHITHQVCFNFLHVIFRP